MNRAPRPRRVNRRAIQAGGGREVLPAPTLLGNLPPHQLISRLQTTVGNRAVARLLDGTQQSAPPAVLQRLTRTQGIRKARYETLPGTMGTYAKRTGNDSDFDKPRADVTKALSMPRNDDGSLSDQSIAIMDGVQANESQTYMANAAANGPVNGPTTKAEAKKLKADWNDRQWGNSVTGKTDLPEIGNMIKLSTVPDAAVVSTVKAGSVTLTVHHGTRDVNLKPRLTMFKTAISKIESAGFTLPGAMVVHLPKWGREIDAATLCESKSTPRAVFNPPNFVHLSSAVVGNPIDSTFGDGTGKDFYKNLSTELDPSGSASVVHELGHMMHYTSSPSNFYSLHGTSFQGQGGNIAAKVSAYAFGAPREFVAEVFMGLVYGKNFDDDVLTMYASFGGAMSGKIQARINKAKAKGPLVHTRTEARPAKKTPGRIKAEKAAARA